MSVNRADLLSALQRRLCDASGQIWTAEELEGYIDDGYSELTKRTGCLFDTSMLPDFAFSFTCNADWEKPYFAAGQYVNGPARFTCEFERDYIDNARGPANHNQNWEFNAGHVGITEIAALVDLPEALQEIERATWNTRRIAALRSSDVEERDGRYELNKGEVCGYMQDKDGLGVLRKFRVPSSPYVPYSFDTDSDLFAFTMTQSWEADYFSGVENGPAQFTYGFEIAFALTTDVGPADHNYTWEAAQGYALAQTPNDDGFGILRNLSGIADLTVNSEGFGDLVQVPGQNVFEDFGILGPIYPDNLVVRIEYRRRGATLSETQDFEIAGRYAVYVRHYAQARALEREGPGQDLKLAKNFSERYEAGISRMLRRKQAMQYQRTYVMGGTQKRREGPPLARLPWQYGAVVRR